MPKSQAAFLGCKWELLRPQHFNSPLIIFLLKKF